MPTETIYHPSRLLRGETELLRQHSFTRWMSRDLLQAATDFCRNLGLHAIYCETSPDQLGRYLLWRWPAEVRCEIRSGRTREQFEAFDEVNAERGMPLLTMHINESDIYSAVWLSREHHETAKAFLAAHGITVAERREA